MSSRANIGVVRAAAVALLVVPITAGAGFEESSRRVAATVERIIDGDTLVVRGGARVRLVQIDAPEAGEECYASGSTTELVRLARPGTRVELEEDAALDRVDRYGRLLRYVHAGGRNVNVELVQRGAATPWFYDGDRGRYAARLLASTSSARAARRGMWGACRVSWRPDGPVTTRSR
jgi:micrococcal nuclease